MMRIMVMAAGVFLLVGAVAAPAQSAAVAALEQSAAEAFEKKAYSSALQQYNKLLEMYPRDPQYNYRAGVCMVELGQEPRKAIYRLKIASLKEVPEDVFFYLGKACMQAGRYDEAIGWYERFGREVSPGVRKRYHLEKYLGEAKMARDRRGAPPPPPPPPPPPRHPRRAGLPHRPGLSPPGRLAPADHRT